MACVEATGYRPVVVPGPARIDDFFGARIAGGRTADLIGELISAPALTPG